MFEYIQGEKFKYWETDKIFYSSPHNLKEIPKTAKVLVTHNSDKPASFVYDLVKDWLNEDRDRRWFTSNLDIDYNRIYPLPIGIENNLWQERDNKIDKICKIVTQRSNKEILCNAIFNPDTHQSRQSVMDHFIDKKWCVAYPSINGLGFDQYLKIIHYSKFTICPRGNGIDTHRLWEVLYTGGIAIIEDNLLNKKLYFNMPNVVIVKNFKSINEPFLNELWSTKEKYWSAYSEWFKLDMKYWRNLINNAV